MHPLGHRNYRLFVAGQLVSLVGTWTQTYAQDWLVYRLTNSPFWLGVVSLCQQLPVFLLATLGGVIADRYPRRSVLLATQSAAMVFAFVLAALTFRGGVRIAHVLVLGALLGVTEGCVDIPTQQQSFVSRPRPDVEELCFAGCSRDQRLDGHRRGVRRAGDRGRGRAGARRRLVLSRQRRELHRRDRRAGRDARVARAGGRSRARIGPDARARGVPFCGAGASNVRALLVPLLAVTALVAIPVATLMPVVAKETLHGDARTYGWLGGAMGGGALVSALVIAARKDLAQTDLLIAIVALRCSLGC